MRCDKEVLKAKTSNLLIIKNFVQNLIKPCIILTNNRKRYLLLIKNYNEISYFSVMQQTLWKPKAGKH